MIRSCYPISEAQNEDDVLIRAFSRDVTTPEVAIFGVQLRMLRSNWCRSLPVLVLLVLCIVVGCSSRSGRD